MISVLALLAMAGSQSDQPPKLELLLEQVGKSVGNIVTLRVLFTNKSQTGVYMSENISVNGHIVFAFRSSHDEVIVHHDYEVIHGVKDTDAIQQPAIGIYGGHLYGRQLEFHLDRLAKGVRAQVVYTYLQKLDLKGAQLTPEGERNAIRFRGELKSPLVVIQ